MVQQVLQLELRRQRRQHGHAGGHGLDQRRPGHVGRRGEDRDPAAPEGRGPGGRPVVGHHLHQGAERLGHGRTGAPGRVAGPQQDQRAHGVGVDAAQRAQPEAHAHPVAAARHQHHARGRRRVGGRRGDRTEVDARADEPVVARQHLGQGAPAGLGGRDPQVDPRQRPVDQRAQEGHPGELLRPVEGGRGHARRMAQRGQGRARRQRLVHVHHVERGAGQRGLERRGQVEGTAQAPPGAGRQGPRERGDGHLARRRQQRLGVASGGPPEPGAPRLHQLAPAARCQHRHPMPARRQRRRLGRHVARHVLPRWPREGRHEGDGERVRQGASSAPPDRGGQAERLSRLGRPPFPRATAGSARPRRSRPG